MGLILLGIYSEEITVNSLLFVRLHGRVRFVGIFFFQGNLLRQSAVGGAACAARRTVVEHGNF